MQTNGLYQGDRFLCPPPSPSTARHAHTKARFVLSLTFNYRPLLFSPSRIARFVFCQATLHVDRFQGNKWPPFYLDRDTANISHIDEHWLVISSSSFFGIIRTDLMVMIFFSFSPFVGWKTRLINSMNKTSRVFCSFCKRVSFLCGFKSSFVMLKPGKDNVRQTSVNLISYSLSENVFWNDTVVLEKSFFSSQWTIYISVLRRSSFFAAKKHK